MLRKWTRAHKSSWELEEWEIKLSADSNKNLSKFERERVSSQTRERVWTDDDSRFPLAGLKENRGVAVHAVV